MSDIRKRCNELYEIIKSSKEELEQIRKKCPHKESVIGNYMIKLGHSVPGLICIDCNEFLGGTV